MFRAADSNLRDARRSLASPFADVSPVLRRRRGFSASAVRRSAAFLAAAFLFSSFLVSDARAQLFKNGPFAPIAPNSGARDASASRPSSPAANPPQLFTGKYVRSLADSLNLGVDASPRPEAVRPATPNVRQTPPSPSAQRSTAPTRTAPPTAETLAQASTSRESAREAVAKIPWNALSPEARQKLQELTTNPTIYRRLPMSGGRCNPEFFDFILGNPHALVAFWNQTGFDDLTASKKAPYQYEVREKTGTLGIAQVLYQDSELTVVYCSGSYRGPIVPRSLEGEMLVLLQTRYTEDPARNPIVVCRLDAFVDLKNPGADLLARTFAGPLGKLADSNFEQTIASIDNLSYTAENAPNELLASISKLGSLSPETRRLLAAKTLECARQASLRAQGELVEYRLLPKKNLPAETFARILAREQNGRYSAQASARPQAPRRAETANFAQTPPKRSGSDSLYAPRPTANPTVSPRVDDFDRPSLAKNSFALADDVDFSLADDENDDFESTIDWDDDESALDAESLSNLPSDPQTSLATVRARPASKYADALELLEENLTDSPASDALEFSTDATETPETFDETEIVDETLDATDATTAPATDDETIAFPTFPKNSTTRRFSSAKPRPLTATDPLESTSEAKPLAENAELPLLRLPEPAASNTLETDSSAESQSAELAPQAKPILTAAVPTISNEGGSVWRAVKADAKSQNSPKRPAVAKPKVVAETERVVKTAQVETQVKEGVTFRQPRFQ